MPLGLSAFVYVPFGEGVMRYVQRGLFALKLKCGGNLMSSIFSLLNDTTTAATVATDGLNTATSSILSGSAGIWDVDVNSARQKLKPARLKDQMFAYTVTNQIVDTFNEIGLPFVMRFAVKLWNGKPKPDPIEKKANINTNEEENKEEGYLDQVREEVELPEYDLFGDYSEMVIQFGYVTLWSTIWPLAPGEFYFFWFQLERARNLFPSPFLNFFSYGTFKQHLRVRVRCFQIDGPPSPAYSHPNRHDGSMA